MNYEINNIIFAMGGVSSKAWSEEEHSLLMEAAGYLLLYIAKAKSGNKIGG